MHDSMLLCFFHFSNLTGDHSLRQWRYSMNTTHYVRNSYKALPLQALSPSKPQLSQSCNGQRANHTKRGALCLKPWKPQNYSLSFAHGVFEDSKANNGAWRSRKPRNDNDKDGERQRRWISQTKRRAASFFTKIALYSRFLSKTNVFQYLLHFTDTNEGDRLSLSRLSHAGIIKHIF